jgi:hypothetical protein
MTHSILQKLSLRKPAAAHGHMPNTAACFPTCLTCPLPPSHPPHAMPSHANPYMVHSYTVLYTLSLQLLYTPTVSSQHLMLPSCIHHPAASATHCSTSSCTQLNSSAPAPPPSPRHQMLLQLEGLAHAAVLLVQRSVQRHNLAQQALHSRALHGSRQAARCVAQLLSP